MLSLVLEKAPAQARSGIEAALNKSMEKKIRIENTTASSSDIKEKIMDEIKRGAAIREQIQEKLEDKTKIPENKKEQTVCIQVITPARNPATGEVREFPTSCDMPSGWLRTELTGTILKKPLLPVPTSITPNTAVSMPQVPEQAHATDKASIIETPTVSAKIKEP